LKNNIFIFCKMRRGGRREDKEARGRARGRPGARRDVWCFEKK
jgi:hypothetical protein